MKRTLPKSIILCNPITPAKITKIRIRTMTKIRWTVLGFMIVAALVFVLSRKPPPPSPLSAHSPAIPPAKVKPQLEVTYGAAILLAPDASAFRVIQ